MKNTWKLAPLFVLAFVMFGCGGGGGTASPQDLARGVVDKIKAADFEGIYSMQPLHLEDPEYAGVRREYRIAEGFDKWKWEEDRITGNKDKGIEAQDPEEKSGVKDEESWKAASAETLWALRQGLYKLHGIKKFEERVTGAEFYLTSVRIYTINDGGREYENRFAKVSFANKFGDGIEVECVEDQGLWYLSDVDVEFPEELPEPPKDE